MGSTRCLTHLWTRRVPASVEPARVVAIHGANLEDERRAAFINDFAAAYDKFVASYGEQPDAFVMVMGGVSQTCRASWTIKGKPRGSNTSMLAMAHAVLLKEIIYPDAY